MSSSFLVSKFLEPSQRSAIALNLANDLTNIDNVIILNDLLISLPNDETILQISKIVEKFFKMELIKKSEKLILIEDNNLMETLIKLPLAWKEVLKWCEEEILQNVVLKELGSSISLEFDELIKKYITFSERTQPVLQLEEGILLQFFKFLEKVYTFSNDIIIPESLDRLVLLFTIFKEDNISTKAIKTLRFKDFSSFSNLHEYIWQLTRTTLSSSSSSSQQMSNVYITWLRLLISHQTNKTSNAFLSTCHKSSEYWKLIQLGLTSQTHEHRKYSLSILRLSIQQITSDIDNEYIYFPFSDSFIAIDSWKRFCTLYEILALDTALNQAIAAKPDILSLLSLKSPIKPSWGLTLLSTGFKANMESVRKFSLNVMFQVKQNDLCIFNSGNLCDVFLKYATEAQHFHVNGSLICQYGVQLENFVSGVLKGLNETLLVETVEQILGYLSNEMSESFGPARIYLTKGLLKGLRTPVLKESHVQMIHRLFDTTAEDPIFEKYLQNIHLKLLTKIKCNVCLVLESLVKFVQCNGWELFVDNLELFYDYISVNHSPEEDPIEFETREPEFQVVYYSLFMQQSSISEMFLKTLAVSGLEFDQDLNTKFSKLLSRLVQSEEDVITDEYTNSESLCQMEIFSANSFKGIDLSKLSQAVISSLKKKDDFNLDRFTFFTKIYAKVMEVSDNQIFEFDQLILLGKYLTCLSSDYDFKTVDIIKTNYLSLIETFIKSNPIDECQMSTLLTTLSANIGFFHSNIKLCQIIQYLINNYINIDFITVMEILESIWNQFSEERLVLNQLPMHLTFIETLFHEIVLKDCINNEYNSKIVAKIALKIIELSVSRRSLLPKLSHCLWVFAQYYHLEFEQCEWLFPVLIKIIKISQEDSNSFKLRTVIATKYNRDCGFGQGDIYEKIYGDEEVSAKINIISILSECSEKYLTLFFEYLVQDDPFNIIHPIKKTDGVEEIQRLFSFSLLLFLSQKIDKSILSTYVGSTLLPALESEASPLVRSYMEWLIALDSVSNETNNRDQIFNSFKDQSKPVLVTSVERIAFLISTKLPENTPETYKFFKDFTSYLIPNCSSNKPLIRHFSNSLILSIYPEIEKRGLILPIGPVLKLLYDQALKLAQGSGKFRTGDALIWDIQEDYNLSGIFGGVLSRISPRDVRLITKEELDKYFKGDDSQISIGSTEKINWTNSSPSLSGDNDNGLPSNSTLQTKSGAWESVIDLSQQTRSVKRTELIVVSSLVDKPPNLGGICRLCDVLGAGVMTVDDLRVKEHPQFKNVAVTADHWMPLLEVKIEDIPTFMKQKKKEGYTLIGLEQTDKSLVLGNDTPFPAKSLILLGREAEGIPGELLAELDYCVEIRQLGVIRSMNIQTATAVIVHAYSSAQTHLHK